MPDVLETTHEMLLKLNYKFNYDFNNATYTKNNIKDYSKDIKEITRTLIPKLQNYTNKNCIVEDTSYGFRLWAFNNEETAKKFKKKEFNAYELMDSQYEISFKKFQKFQKKKN